MRAAHAALLLLVVTAGCATGKPLTPASPPTTVATQPGAPKPAARPATPKPLPAVAPRAGTPGSPVAQAPAAAPALDLKTLVAQLKETKAIGFFTKITLKNQIDDLLDQFREYYQGKAKLTMKELRRAYDLLLMKVLSLLQDEDQPLASAIVASRDAIWGLLADPKKFATIQD